MLYVNIGWGLEESRHIEKAKAAIAALSKDEHSFLYAPPLGAVGIPYLMMVSEVPMLIPETIDLIIRRLQVAMGPNDFCRLCILAGRHLRRSRREDDPYNLIDAAGAMDTNFWGVNESTTVRVLRHWLLSRFAGTSANVGYATHADWCKRRVVSGFKDAAEFPEGPRVHAKLWKAFEAFYDKNSSPPPPTA